nr:MAG TPA: hypothetical protein [Caudoviricetes sp.]
MFALIISFIKLCVNRLWVFISIFFYFLLYVQKKHYFKNNTFY